MNRRGFLSSLAGMSATAVLSEEIAQMLSPKRLIMLPPPMGWLQEDSGIHLISPEYVRTTIRAYLPKLINEVCDASPLFQHLMNNARKSGISISGMELEFDT